MLRRSSVKLRQHVSNYFASPQQRRTFQEKLEQCTRTNVDMASTSSSDFLELQFRLIAYRFSRLGHELGQIYMHPFAILPSISMSIFHVIALPVTFVLAYYTGRMQISSLESPPKLSYAPSTVTQTEKE